MRVTAAVPVRSVNLDLVHVRTVGHIKKIMVDDTPNVCACDIQHAETNARVKVIVIHPKGVRIPVYADNSAVARVCLRGYEQERNACHAEGFVRGRVDDKSRIGTIGYHVKNYGLIVVCGRISQAIGGSRCSLALDNRRENLIVCYGRCPLNVLRGSAGGQNNSCIVRSHGV